MSYSIPGSKELYPRQFANPFMRVIIGLYGLQQDIISDRGTLFTPDLWKEITRQLGIEQRLSTAVQLQTYCPTEPPNAIVEQYLKACINYQQDDL